MSARLSIRVPALVACGILTVVLFACDRSGTMSEATEYRPRTFDTGSSAAIVVVAANGSVSIRGESGRTRTDVTAILRASGRSAGRAQERVEGLAAKMTQAGERVELRFEPPAEAAQWDEAPSVRFEVLAPSFTSVSIETVNGDVDISGIEGTMNLDVAKGRIDISGVRGVLAVQAEWTDIVVEESEVLADLETRLGDIAFSGRLVGTENRLVASYGGVALKIPPDSELEIAAEVVTGRIESSLPFDGEMTEHEWAAILNAPTTRVFLRASNGSIRIDALENI